MKELKLPTTIAELGIDVFDKNNIEIIADFACRDESEIHSLPFEINKKDIIEIISNFEKEKINI